MELTSLDIKDPGLRTLPPGVERYYVRGGGLSVIEVLPEGLQWCTDKEARGIAEKALACLLKNLETIPSQCLQNDELTSLINLVISTCEHCTRRSHHDMAIKLCLATIPLVQAAPAQGAANRHYPRK